MNNNSSDQTETSPAMSEPLMEDTGKAAHATNDELARALALIEARKRATEQRATDTSRFAPSVEELELGVTPEELVSEVQILRENTADATLSSTSVLASQSLGQFVALTHCPACSRKLLTQASALCNWCGAKIDDPKYQEQAARSRQELDQSELTQLETMVLEETRYGIFGRLKRRAKNVGNKNPLG